MATKSTLQSMLDLAGKFVIDQKGCWEHADWEVLLAKVGAMGMALSDETKRNLGNILESCKYFYANGAGSPAKEEKARPKAKPKAKVRA